MMSYHYLAVACLPLLFRPYFHFLAVATDFPLFHDLPRRLYLFLSRKQEEYVETKPGKRSLQLNDEVLGR